jgi:hypothetical protein
MREIRSDLIVLSGKIGSVADDNEKVSQLLTAIETVELLKGLK